MVYLNVIKHYIALNMHEESVHQIVNVRARDAVHRLIITINECSTRYTFTDHMFAQFVWKADEEAEYNDCAAVIVNDAVIVDLPRTAALTLGQTECQVRLYDGRVGADGAFHSVLVTSPGFWLNVIDRVSVLDEERPGPNEVETWDTAYERIVSTWGEAEEATKAANEAAAEARVARDTAREIVNSLVAITNAEIDEICI